MVVLCSSQMGHAALWRSQPKESVFAVVQHSMPKVSKQNQLHLNIQNCLVRYTTFNKADVLIKQLANIDLNHLAVLFQSGWGPRFLHVSRRAGAARGKHGRLRLHPLWLILSQGHEIPRPLVCVEPVVCTVLLWPPQCLLQKGASQDQPGVF